MTLRRTITHWTAGGNRANDTDKKHYHFITEWDGTIIKGNHEPADNVVTSDGDYAAHVLNLNTGSIGVAMAGMAGAVEQPFDAGPSPLTEKQFEAHCLLLAELHREHAIPVTRETCLTHAEVQPTLGVVQRGKWDISRLPFKPELRGALPVGDYMRERVKSYMAAGGIDVLPAAKSSFLRAGMQGDEVKALQRDLARLGYHLGEIDGKFGRLTKEAVMAFQSENGLEIDGVAGPQTQSAILTKAAPRPERDKTEAGLRAEGSRTIQEADKVAGAGTVIGVASLGGAVAQADAVVAALEGAQGVAGRAGALLAGWGPWIVLALVGVAVVLWARRIVRTRVEDARLGRNLGR